MSAQSGELQAEKSSVIPTGRSAPIRVVALAPTPAPYRAFEYDWMARELGPRISFHLLFLERSWSDMAWTDELPKIATWEALPRVTWKALQRVPGLRRVNTGVVRALERAQADIVLLHGYDAPALWTAWRWANRNRRGILYRSDSNGLDERERGGGFWRTVVKARALHWFFSRIDSFLPIGSANEDYLRLYGAPDERFFRTGYQVNNELYQKIADQERAEGMPLRAKLGITTPRLVLYVGRFVWEKRILDLVDAFKRILPDFPDTGLLLAGDGPLRGEIEARCADIRSSVYMPGFFQPADVARAFAIADVMVLPSVHDAWGLVVNEALAAGVPVIASHRVGAAPDLVISGVSGEQFPACDVAALAEQLRKVLSSERSADYRAGARRQIAEWTARYDPVRAFDQAIDFALRRRGRTK